MSVSSEFRFSPALIVVTAAAHKEARKYNHGLVSPDHWLLALLKHPNLSRPFDNLGLSEDVIRSKLEEPTPGALKQSTSPLFWPAWRVGFVRGSQPVNEPLQPHDELLDLFMSSVGYSERVPAGGLRPSHVIESILNGFPTNVRLLLRGDASELLEDVKKALAGEGVHGLRVPGAEEGLLSDLSEIERHESFSIRALSKIKDPDGEQTRDWLTKAFERALDPNDERRIRFREACREWVENSPIPTP